MCSALELADELFKEVAEFAFHHFGGLRDFIVRKLMLRDSSGRIGDTAERANAQAQVVGRNRLRNSAHADRAATDHLQVAHFGRSFIGRTAHAAVDAS